MTRFLRRTCLELAFEKRTDRRGELDAVVSRALEGRSGTVHVTHTFAKYLHRLADMIYSRLEMVAGLPRIPGIDTDRSEIPFHLVEYPEPLERGVDLC